MIDMNKSLRKSVELPIGETTINVYIHEENSRALILEMTLPTQFRPRSKHYSGNTIWFRVEIVKRGINICNIYAV